MLDHISELNAKQEEEFGDPEINSRIAQYEMAYRMQTSVPTTMNIDDEPEHIKCTEQMQQFLAPMQLIVY